MRRRKLTTEEFIQKAKNIHCEKYDYSKTNIIRGQCKVILICKIHGEFFQSIYKHIGGNGCPKCKGVWGKQSLNNFLLQAKEVHGDRYDYSKVEYKNAH
jgi:Zn-finger nucleic acid-binding protein